MAQELNLAVNHIVAESTNILSTNFGGGHIYSIEVQEDMDNGLLVARSEFVADEYEDEVWKAKVYAAGDEPLLLLNPPLLPMTELRGYATEDKFYNAKGDRVRAYTLRVGDRITLSEVAFDVAPAAKQYVTYDAAAKQYVVGDSKTEGQFCAQVLTVIPRTNMMMYKIQVVSL
jgi:hypothetical protein